MAFRVPEMYRWRNAPGGWSSVPSDGNNSAFLIPMRGGYKLRVIASDGDGWEHVSVSLADRCPTWDEMCRVKRLFWDAEDTVVQYHPPESEYVNLHPFCLHLWRPVAGEILLPPSYL